MDMRASAIAASANSSYVLRAVTSFFEAINYVYATARSHTFRAFRFSTIHCSIRLRWVLDNIPAVREAAADGDLCFGTIDTWLLWRLSGRRVHATDYSCASTSALFDPFLRDWSGFVPIILGLPKGILLPEVKDTSSLFGTLDPAIFGVDIPIAAIVGDQQASMFGQGCYNAGDTKITLGTGAFVNINTGAAPSPSNYKSVIPLIGWKIGTEMVYMCESRSRGCGSVIEWGKRFGLYSDPRDIEGICASVPDSGNVTFVSSFFGLEAPHDDDSSRGAIMGLTANSTPAHTTRALMESICFQVAELFGVLAENFHIRTPVRIDGGVSKNNTIVQLIASLVDGDIERGSESDATLLGAAHLAGLAVGFWGSRAELQTTRRVDRVFVPRPLTEGERNSRKWWTDATQRTKNWTLL
jgi:putative glycerol kinase 5